MKDSNDLIDDSMEIVSDQQRNTGRENINNNNNSMQ